MAIELDTNSEPTLVHRGEIPTTAVPFAVNGTEADASTAVEVKPAPGAGKNLYITSVLLTSDDADANPQLQDNASTPALLFGPFHTTVEGVVVRKDFPNLVIKVATNQAIDLKAAAGGHVSVWVEGLSG